MAMTVQMWIILAIVYAIILTSLISPAIPSTLLDKVDSLGCILLHIFSSNSYTYQHISIATLKLYSL